MKWIYPHQIWAFEGHGGVYLTFDDGPQMELTPWLLDYLKSEGIEATFFLLGEQVEKHPELVQLIRENGHDIGNHGFKHFRIGEVPADEYYDNFLKGQQFQTINYFRPPYGKLNRSMVHRIGAQSKIVMWSWLSYDFDAKVANWKIVNKLKNQVKEGDILVFHENEYTKNRLKTLLPKAIEVIKNKGLQFKKFPQQVKL